MSFARAEQLYPALWDATGQMRIMDVFFACLHFSSVSCISFCIRRPLGRIMSLCFLESFWIILGYHPSYLLPGPKFPEASPAGFFFTTFYDLVSISILIRAFRSGFRQHDRGVCIYIDFTHSKDNPNHFKQCPTYLYHGFLLGQNPTMDFHH